MKAIILKDRHNIHAVFIRNQISEQEVRQLQDIATHYMQEIVVKETTPLKTVGEMIDEIRTLNQEDMEDEHPG